MTTRSKLLAAGAVLLLFVVLATGIAAWRAKARADLYRARVEVLEEAISRMREEAAAADRDWKARLSEAVRRYEAAEKKWAEARRRFDEWKPANPKPPSTSAETVRRLRDLGIDAREGS